MGPLSCRFLARSYRHRIRPRFNAHNAVEAPHTFNAAEARLFFTSVADRAAAETLFSSSEGKATTIRSSRSIAAAMTGSWKKGDTQWGCAYSCLHRNCGHRGHDPCRSFLTESRSKEQTHSSGCSSPQISRFLSFRKPIRLLPSFPLRPPLQQARPLSRTS